MRAVSSQLISLLGLVSLSLMLGGCPEKTGAPADKTSAEPERAEPDDDSKGDHEGKKAAPAAPAAAPPAADDKKPDDAKDDDKGGW
jgi:hypothetical protein